VTTRRAPIGEEPPPRSSANGAGEVGRSADHIGCERLQPGIEAHVWPDLLERRCVEDAWAGCSCNR